MTTGDTGGTRDFRETGDAGLSIEPQTRQGPGMLALRGAIVAALAVGAFQGFAAYTVHRAGLDLGPFENFPPTSFFRNLNLVEGLGGLAAFLLIVFGPAPRLATRWAWFWLSAPLTIGWLVFALIEPVMLLTGRPVAQPTRRLTGGWAFLLAIGIGIGASAILPGLT